MSCTEGFVYVVRDPTRPPRVFKLGRTRDFVRRLREYPARTEVVACSARLVDCHTTEANLIRAFRKRFEIAEGREYFRGARADVEAEFRSMFARDPSPMEA